MKAMQLIWPLLQRCLCMYQHALCHIAFDFDKTALHVGPSMLIGSRPSIAKLLLILKIAQLAQQAFEPQALIIQPCECNAKVVFNVQDQCNRQETANQ